jgi:hypothetical protein
VGRGLPCCKDFRTHNLHEFCLFVVFAAQIVYSGIHTGYENFRNFRNLAGVDSYVAQNEKAMLKHFLLTILLLSAIAATAQREDLTLGLPFFEQKTAEYQRWLDAKGFGAVLTVERVRLKVDRNNQTDPTELEMFLLLKSTDADTAMAKWNRLKTDFDTDADSLEAYLFRTYVHMMEIPEAQGNIQIYVRDKYGSYVKDNHIWIWSENGLIVSEKKVAVSKAKSFEISVSYPVNKTGKGNSTKLSAAKRRSANAVFDLILKHVKTAMLDHPRYQKELADRRPRIESDSVRTTTTFKFTVTDLGREVLTDQTRWVWEKWVGINTIAMERLSFQFEYIPAADGGYSLKCMVDGKFGSGLFKPRTSGYMNMEPDFDDFFEKYKNDFRLTLQRLLQEKP